MDEATDDRQGTRVLRRYSNRKFYDPSESRYVNYDEIARIIRTGSEVRVLEFDTKRDVTGMTLARILSREERRASCGSAQALSELIRNLGSAGATRPDEAGEAGETAPGRSSLDPASPGDGGRGAERACARDPVDGGDLVRRLLSHGHRSAWSAGQTASAALEALARLDGRARERAEVASEVVARIERVWRALSRITRRIHEVHEQLRELEEN